jgi:hypothetical protein
VRAVEQKLSLQLEKPPRAAACLSPPAPAKRDTETDIELRKSQHQLMA